jgi:hypothetical protein
MPAATASRVTHRQPSQIRYLTHRLTGRLTFRMPILLRATGLGVCQAALPLARTSYPVPQLYLGIHCGTTLAVISTSNQPADNSKKRRGATVTGHGQRRAADNSKKRPRRRGGGRYSRSQRSRRR